jgi:hypothetical protein
MADIILGFLLGTVSGTIMNFSNTMLVEEVPQAEREDLARQVADKVLASLKDGTTNELVSQPSCMCE